MSSRRHFLKDLAVLGVFPGVATPAFAKAFPAFLDKDMAQEINPDFDAESYDFWSGFLSKVSYPVVLQRGVRGPAGDLQPVFYHYGPQGFKNAAELEPSELMSEGDVSVGLNTSTIKIARQDQQTFEHLQNAQVRVDVAQRNAILPMLEAMAYTVVSGMVSSGSKPPSSGGPKPAASKPSGNKGSVQNIAVESDAAWQKMQNIILPGGEGRWALNLEAQKKDSLMFKLLQNVVKEAGVFAPMVGLPGIALSGLQSFNTLYGAMHARPVPIIKSSPIRVFATREALQKTGTPGAATGIMLKSGTYVLIPANRAPGVDQLKDLTVMQGRIVPPKTDSSQIDEAAAETLADVTYATFDVEVRPVRLQGGEAQPKA